MFAAVTDVTVLMIAFFAKSWIVPIVECKLSAVICHSRNLGNMHLQFQIALYSYQRTNMGCCFRKTKEPLFPACLQARRLILTGMVPLWGQSSTEESCLLEKLGNFEHLISLK